MVENGRHMPENHRAGVRRRDPNAPHDAGKPAAPVDADVRLPRRDPAGLQDAEFDDMSMSQAKSASSFTVGFRDDFAADTLRGPPPSQGRVGRNDAFEDDAFDGGFDAAPPGPPAAPERPAPSRSRQRPAPPGDNDGWAGQSLGDALAPKKAPPAAASSAGRGGGGAKRSSEGADCQKTPAEIITWVRSLPERHVPEKAREQLAAIVENGALGGAAFSDYVQQVPPEICAPKNAMHLKAAWGNVLKEAAAREVALANLNNAPKQKATMMVV